MASTTPPVSAVLGFFSDETETEAAATLEISEEPTAATDVTLDEPEDETETIGEVATEEEEETSAAVVESEEVEAATDEGSAVADEPKPLSIYCGNLSYDTNARTLRALFEEYGTVNKVFVPKDRETGNFRGFGFVEMANREEMERACEMLNKTEFEGRTINVYESKPKEERQSKGAQLNYGSIEGTRIYVGNISFDASTEDVKDYFSKFGEVKDCYMPTNRNTGQPRGFAFVVMDDEPASTAIEESNGIDFFGRPLTVSVSLSRGEKSERSSFRKERRQTTKLYVGNISFQTTSDELMSMFSEYGEVFDCYMPEDRDTGRPRGFAFIQMSPDDASTAVDNTDGIELDGRILRVNEAQPKGYNSANSWNDSGDYEGGGNDDWGYSDDSYGTGADAQFEDDGGWGEGGDNAY